MQKIIFIYFILINIVSFILFTLDEYKSRVNAIRTSENRLHLFSLLGGFVGSTLGMWIWRDKARKLSFLVKHFLIVGMWIVVLFIYFTQINELNFLR